MTYDNLDKTIDELLDEQMDFNSMNTRRVVSALTEIRHLTNELLEKFEEEVDGGNNDLITEDIADYEYFVEMIAQMVDRLQRD